MAQPFAGYGKLVAPFCLWQLWRVDETLCNFAEHESYIDRMEDEC